MYTHCLQLQAQTGLSRSCALNTGDLQVVLHAHLRHDTLQIQNKQSASAHRSQVRC